MLWMYAHVKRDELLKDKKEFENTKLLCLFINPEKYRAVFSERQSVVNAGFYDDLAKIDPSFDRSKYEGIINDLDTSGDSGKGSGPDHYKLMESMSVSASKE